MCCCCFGWRVPPRARGADPPRQSERNSSTPAGNRRAFFKTPRWEFQNTVEHLKALLIKISAVQSAAMASQELQSQLRKSLTHTRRIFAQQRIKRVFFQGQHSHGSVTNLFFRANILTGVLQTCSSGPTFSQECYKLVLQGQHYHGSVTNLFFRANILT